MDGPSPKRKLQLSNDVDPPEWAELVLPWLTHRELAAVAGTCKSLHRTSQSITRRRSLDASKSLEPHPIPFSNPNPNIPHPKPYHFFLYAPSQFLPPSPTRQPWGGPRLPTRPPVGESFECACDGGGDGLFEEAAGIVMECGPGCRVTRSGMGVKLKVVWDGRKGWGLVADRDIPRRQFVCEYAGELLTTKEARSRQKIYDDLSSSGKFYSALLVVREHLPSGKACLRVNIDATCIGNIARFINHSCDGGNLSTVLVRTAGSLLPRLCFFAAKDIREGEELTFSYGEIRVRSNKGLPCYCGSSCCYGTLPSEST